jgi:glycerol-3-phosphate dehydrogenase
VHGAGTVLPADDPLSFYGSDAALIRMLMRDRPELAKAVHPRLPLTAAEVVWHVRHEMARTVGDVLARRTRWLLLDAQASLDAAGSVAAIMARELGWDAETIQTQTLRYQQLAAGYLLEG